MIRSDKLEVNQIITQHETLICSFCRCENILNEVNCFLGPLARINIVWGELIMLSCVLHTCSGTVRCPPSRVLSGSTGMALRQTLLRSHWAQKWPNSFVPFTLSSQRWGWYQGISIQNRLITRSLAKSPYPYKSWWKPCLLRCPVGILLIVFFC